MFKLHPFRHTNALIDTGIAQSLTQNMKPNHKTIKLVGHLFKLDILPILFEAKRSYYGEFKLDILPILFEAKRSYYGESSRCTVRFSSFFRKSAPITSVCTYFVNDSEVK